jgi:hypothetical protein
MFLQQEVKRLFARSQGAEPLFNSRFVLTPILPQSLIWIEPIFSQQLGFADVMSEALSLMIEYTQDDPTARRSKQAAGSSSRVDDGRLGLGCSRHK